MLQFIRDKSQGWIAGTIIGMIVIVFALWGVRSYLYSAQENMAVAEVDGTPITQQQFNMVYNQLKRQQQMELGANYVPSESATALLKQTALQGIISNLLLTNSAISDGFSVAPELVDVTLAKMPIFQINGAFSEARFQQVLNGLLYSPDQFYDEVGHNILINQVQFGLTGSAFSLPSEVMRMVQLINQKRTFDYAVLPATRFLSQVKLDSQAVEDYYKNHSDEFQIPESVSIDYIDLSLSDIMKQINPTEQQVKSFYDNNIESYTKPQEWKVSRILISVPLRATAAQQADAKKRVAMMVQKIKAGQGFDSLAKQYSDDKATSDQGGEMPWQNGGQFSSEVRTVLPTLKRAGDISEPIQVAGQGYVIIKVLGIKPAEITPYSAVRQKVFQMYKQHVAEQKFSDMSDQLSNITYESPDSLTPAAQKLGLRIQSTALFTQKGGAEKITQDPRILQAAFSDVVVNQHDNSDPVNLTDNEIVILRAKQYIPATVKPLAVVRAGIEKKLEIDAAEKNAAQLGQQVIASLNQGMSLQQAASKYAMAWRHVNNAGRHEKSIDSDVLMLVFQSPVPSKIISRVNTGSTLGNGNFAIISLTQVLDGETPILSSSQYHIFSQGAENNFGQKDYISYAQGLMQKAKIKKYDQTINQ